MTPYLAHYLAWTVLSLGVLLMGALVSHYYRTVVPLIWALAVLMFVGMVCFNEIVDTLSNL